MRIHPSAAPADPCTLLEELHPAPLGTMVSFWTPRGLYRVDWIARPFGSHREAGPLDGPPEHQRRVERFEQALAGYFDGDCGSFDSLELDPAGWTPFLSAVYRVCREIRPGQTLTYGQMAALAGSPRAARAVGQAMATNRLILVIPCHRVVASGGRLGGYGGPGGLATKRWLLEHETGQSPLSTADSLSLDFSGRR